MAHPEHLIAPMRADLTRYGVEEARTPADVDRLLAPGTGTVLMVVNSVCGCAAGKARPAVGLALQHRARPAKAATVFAAGDDEAVARLRRHTDLPLCIGFGIRTAEHAADVARRADGVVVGSALVDRIAKADTPKQAIHDVLTLCSELAAGVRGARG